MCDTDRAERLLSLFTSSDRAAAIAGDLTEEREHQGGAWFWLHVVRTALALWRSAVTDAPLGVIALAVMGCALFTGPAFGGAAAVNLFPQSLGPPASWVTLACFWWGGAFCIGASLVALAPRYGMAACATLAVAGEALLIAFGATAPWHGLWVSEFLPFYVTGLVVAAPVVAGGAIARRGMNAGAILTLEPGLEPAPGPALRPRR